MQAAGQEDLFNAADWRGPLSSARPSITRVEPSKPARSSKPSLHLRSEPAGLVKERERAADIVAATKGVVTSTFEDVRFGRRIQVDDLKPVVAAISASVARSPMALPSVTRLKDKHEYTFLHSIAVCGLMVGLARELTLSTDLVMEIGLAGLLHDVGKAMVPVSLLDKPGPLDLHEYAIVQQHTKIGYELLRQSGIESDIALDVVLHHHERPDGKGYPTGVSAQALSIYARMGAVCDVYDAVTSSRVYKKRWSPGGALDWMVSTQGQFDPRVLGAFRRMIGVFPVGSLVRLESHRLAVVLNEPPEHPSAPDVCVTRCAETKRDLPGRKVSTLRDPIVSLEDPKRWHFSDWETRRDSILAEYGSY